MAVPVPVPTASVLQVIDVAPLSVKPAVVIAPVNVVAPTESEKVILVQLVPPIVKAPAVVVSIELAVNGPHFIVPVKMSILEVADPSIAVFLLAIPNCVSEERPLPIIRATAFESTAAVLMPPDAVNTPATPRVPPIVVPVLVPPIVTRLSPTADAPEPILIGACENLPMFIAPSPVLAPAPILNIPVNWVYPICNGSPLTIESTSVHRIPLGNEVAPTVSEKFIPVQLVPPMVRFPGFVVSIELVVNVPHFTEPVKMSILEVPNPSIVVFLDAIPSCVSEERPLPRTRATVFASIAAVLIPPVAVNSAVVVVAPVTPSVPAIVSLPLKLKSVVEIPPENVSNEVAVSAYVFRR